MLVSHVHKFCYIRPPRTGSGEVTKALMSFFSAQAAPGTRGHSTVWRPAFDNYFCFIVVRNPYPRMVSLWKRMLVPLKKRHPDMEAVMRKRPSIPFRNFVAHPRLQAVLRQMRCHYYTHKAHHVDAVCKMETLNADLQSLPFANVPDGPRFPPELPREYHVSQYNRPWYEEYDEGAAAQVQKLWAEDFSEYEYPTEFKWFDVNGSD